MPELRRSPVRGAVQGCRGKAVCRICSFAGLFEQVKNRYFGKIRHIYRVIFAEMYVPCEGCGTEKEEVFGMRTYGE